MKSGSTMKRRGKAQKSRITISPAREIVDYLNRVRKAEKKPSMTATLEDIVRERIEREQREEVERQFTAFYDTITPEEQAEEKAWGEIGGRALLASGDE